MTQSYQSGSNNRFALLLQPIKDLSENWEVNLCDLLDSFLSELSQTPVSLDGGGKIMNFAEAALVLQGTASVYSRKVEYLYQLCYQLLDLLSSKKRQKLATDGNDSDGHDDDAGEEAAAGNPKLRKPRRNRQNADEFLSLDDRFEDSLNIDLSEDDDTDQHRLSRLRLPQMPLSLVPLEDYEKMDVKLLSRSGEVIGKKDDFRINTCYVHQNGAVLLDLADLRLVDSSATAAINHQWSDLNATGLPVAVSPDLADTPSFCGDANPESSLTSTIVDVDVVVAPTLTAAPLLAGALTDGDAAVELCANANLQLPHAESIAVTSETAASTRNALGAGATKKFSAQANNNAGQTFGFLDEHDENPKLLRPFKKGVTWRTPEEAATSGSNVLQSSNEFLDAELYSNRPKFPKQSLRVPCWTEFDDVFWKVFKERQNDQRQRAKERARLGMLDAATDSEAEDNDDVFDEADKPPSTDAGFDELADPIANDNDLVIPINQAELPFVADALGVEDENALGAASGLSSAIPVAVAYEDCINKAKSLYEQRFGDLQAMRLRVHDWEERILPILRDEDARKAFDVYAYGKELLSFFSHAGQIVRFDAIAKGKPVFEICRLLLASLLLANHGNVEIVNEHECSVNAFALRLLHATLRNEELQRVLLFGVAGQREDSADVVGSLEADVRHAAAVVNAKERSSPDRKRPRKKLIAK